MSLRIKVSAQSFLCTVALLAIGIDNSVATPMDSGTTWAAHQAVENFCQMEFEGDQEPRRYETIWYSKQEAIKRKQQRDPLPIHSLIFDQDPLVVVASYQIVNVSVQTRSDRASAKVKYRRIARAEGDTQETWHLVAEAPRDEIITLTLIFENGRWWVLDPSSPRVSKGALIQYYELQVNENTKTWEHELNDPNYSDEQKMKVRAVRDRKTEALRILKSLP